MCGLYGATQTQPDRGAFLALGGEALLDDTKNGCVGDYIWKGTKFVTPGASAPMDGKRRAGLQENNKGGAGERAWHERREE